MLANTEPADIAEIAEIIDAIDIIDTEDSGRVAATTGPSGRAPSGVPHEDVPADNRARLPTGRRSSRAQRVLDEIFVIRRWGDFVPIAMAIGILGTYRGTYSITGGFGMVCALAILTIAASTVLITRPRSRGWLAPASLVTVCACTALLGIAAVQSWVIAVPYIAAGMAARRYPPRAAAIVIAAAGLSIIALLTATHTDWVGMLAALAIMLALAMGGIVRRDREIRLEQVELALAREQAAREEHARAAALAERTRIAREIHDVLAHSLSALSLNLQGARLMLAKENASPTALDQIDRARRLAAEGLAEARRAVTALREDPVPLRRAIADLVAEARLATGTAAELTVRGTERALPEPVETALFRTAQESLSNARKHAPGAPVLVELSYRDSDVELVVLDRPGQPLAPTAPSTPAGFGLAGIRERAELIGAEVAVGPVDDGWRVRLVVSTP
ncbi:MAG TPA: histidine kinase [Pseudonocardiaceae bacterium]|jgi:signal transduction histidine kinase|nr:histidine kinase [Pseudonocardiaceae bacterium]